ncbi:hypothetical protein ACFL6C_12570 [Myxococcota bacterium]
MYQKAESGELPSMRVCGLLRFEPMSIRAWARGESAGPSMCVPSGEGT